METNGFCLKPANIIYLDHNATTPLSVKVQESVAAWSLQWGNPSSVHQLGRGPKALVREARNSFAKLIAASPLEIIFTASGSEANNLAIKGTAFGGRKQIILSAVEHPSVLAMRPYLQSLGYSVDVVPVNSVGELDIEKYSQLLSDNTALVSIMYANNETGRVFPIKQLCALAHNVGAVFHCDAVQALGKTVVDVKDWDVDLASFSGHKFYALKGVGALYVKSGVELTSLVHGGGQERARRAGTENALSIASLGLVSNLASEVPSQIEHVSALRDQLEAQLLEKLPGVELVVSSGERLGNTSSLYISGIDGQTLLMNLDLQGICVSTGSACSSGSAEPSPVLLAMDMDKVKAKSVLRISLGWGSTGDEVKRFVDVLTAEVQRMRQL